MSEALLFAKDFVSFKIEDIRVVLHCCKSLLFNGGEVGIKNSKSGKFDVTQGSNDVAEVSELVRIYVLSKINKIFHRQSWDLPQRRADSCIH